MMMMNTLRTSLVTAAWGILFAISLAKNNGVVVDAAVDFLVTSDSTNPDNTDEHFVVRIVDEDSIAIARAEIGKTQGWQIISGIIEKTTAEWNPDWSFHLVPESVFFGEFFMEVCDATVLFVEENLDIAGDAFLPGLFWCPWGTRILEELQQVPDNDSPPSTTTISPTTATTTTTTTSAPSGATGAPSIATETPSLAPTVNVSFVDFLVTSDENNIEDTTQHFVARLTNDTIIATARAELNKTSDFMTMAGTIQKTSVGWNPGWSYHLIPDSVYFGDFFTEECDATAAFIQDNLDEAGIGFLPDLFWCPWYTRVLAEISNTDDGDTTGPTVSPVPSLAPTAHTTMAPSLFMPFVDFLVTSDFTNPLNTSQHFVARMVNESAIADARAELNKTESFRIISGVIQAQPVGWNPGWSYHLLPSSISFADFFMEVCDASAPYVEENLADVGEAFLPGNFWCPWGTRVLAELQAVDNNNGTMASTEPSSVPSDQPSIFTATPAAVPVSPAPSASRRGTMAPTRPASAPTPLPLQTGAPGATTPPEAAATLAPTKPITSSAVTMRPFFFSSLISAATVVLVTSYFV